MNDTELKTGSVGPTPEQIAVATNASRVLRQESDTGRRRSGEPDSELFGEHSAILDLLRQDERLSSLFAARPDRASGNSGGSRPNRESGGRSNQT